MNESKIREALIAWMHAVLEDRDWTAEEWARRAKTSGTNITRFLRGAHGFTPSLKTIMRLAAAAGSLPSLDRVAPVQYVSLPLLSSSTLAMAARSKETMGSALMRQVRATDVMQISVPKTTKPGHFATIITKGANKDELAVAQITLGEDNVDGSIVLVIDGDGDTMVATYQPNASSFIVDRGNGVIQAISEADLTILGRIVSLTKTF